MKRILRPVAVALTLASSAGVASSSPAVLAAIDAELAKG